MFNIGFFPRDVTVPESPTLDGEDEEGPPSYLPTPANEDDSSFGVGSLLEQLQIHGDSLARDGFGLNLLAGEAGNPEEPDLSDAAVDAVLRDIGVDARASPAAAHVAHADGAQRPEEPSPSGAGECEADATTAAETPSARPGGSGARLGRGHLPFGHDWAKTPVQWWPHGWTPRKKYPHEDENSASWRNRSNHYLVISDAGKPIYSRYGDEHSLAAFGGVVQALVSYVATPQAGADTIQTIRAGLHEIVFLLRGPLYLVAITRTGTPYLILQHHLSLLHKVFYMLLTSGLERHFRRNPNLDLKPLLQGTESLFSAVTHSFTWDPSSYLFAFRSLRLHPWLRTTVSGALKSAILPTSPVSYAVVFSGFRIITLAQRKRQQLSATDLYLLLNLINAADSFRRVPETFAPVCLPTLNAAAFHYAHVSYLTKDICLALIAPDASSFAELKGIRETFHATLIQSGALAELAASAQKEQLPLRELLPYLDPLYSTAKAGGITGTNAAKYTDSLEGRASALSGSAAELPVPEPLQMGPGMGYDIIPMGDDTEGSDHVGPGGGGSFDMEGGPMLDDIETMSMRWRGSDTSTDVLQHLPDAEDERKDTAQGLETAQQAVGSGVAHVPEGGEHPSAEAAAAAASGGAGMGPGLAATASQGQGLSRQPLWGPSGLWHFLFKSVQLGQYVTLDFSPLLAEKQAQKRVLKGYQEIFASMHSDGLDPSIPPTIKTQSRRNRQMFILGWSTAEFEFFATFDAFADTKAAVAVCNRVCRLLQSLEADIFLLGPVIV